MIAKLKKELADLELRRDQGIQTRRHVSVEADRVIASTETAVRQGTATLERRFDKLEANLASRSSGRDELLERLLGQPGSSKEIQAEIDARKEDLKRKRREEREEDKQAEKRRKLEQLFEIPLEEGDTLQDGVVLRGDLGRRKMRGLQAVGDFRGRHRGRAVPEGEALRPQPQGHQAAGRALHLQQIRPVGRLCAQARRGARGGHAARRVHGARGARARGARAARRVCGVRGARARGARAARRAHGARGGDRGTGGAWHRGAAAHGAPQQRHGRRLLTVRIETVSVACLGKHQNDIIGKLENPEDQAIVDSWRGKDIFTEKTPNSRIEKGKLCVSGEFLTARATKLGGPEPTVPPVEEPPSKAEIRSFYEEVAREQAQSELFVRERERRESLERMEAAGYQRIRGFLAKPLGDDWIELALEEFYKEAQLRVSSGFQDNYVGKCHLFTGGQIREVKRLPDLDSLAGVQVHVKLLKPRVRIDYKAPVIDQPAPVVPAPAVAAAPAPAEAAPEAPAEEAPEAAPEAPAEAAPEAPAEEAPRGVRGGRPGGSSDLPV